MKSFQKHSKKHTKKHTRTLTQVPQLLQNCDVYYDNFSNLVNSLKNGKTKQSLIEKVSKIPYYQEMTCNHFLSANGSLTNKHQRNSSEVVSQYVLGRKKKIRRRKIKQSLLMNLSF